MTTKEAVALLERYSNYDGMGIPNLAGCKEAMRVAVDALKETYPELRESEDERIRKQHINAIEIGRSNSGISFTEEAASEKHSEEEIRKISKEEYTNGFNDASEIEKQKEQKEIPLMDGDADLYFDNWIQHNNATKRECFEAGITYLYRLLNEQKEQKPAEWSEEDEKWFDYFERLLEFVYNKDPHHLGKLCIGGKMWLKSLRPQYHGDVTMTEAYKMGKEAGEASHWKPSEEQVAALNSLLCRGDFSYIGQAQTLQSLYIDLMKL